MGDQSAKDGGLAESAEIGAVRFDAEGNLLTFDGAAWVSLEQLSEEQPCDFEHGSVSPDPRAEETRGPRGAAVLRADDALDNSRESGSVVRLPGRAPLSQVPAPEDPVHGTILSDPVREAILGAAVVARLGGILSPLPGGLLQELHTLCLDPRERDRDPHEKDQFGKSRFEQALAAATRPDQDGSCLFRVSSDTYQPSNSLLAKANASPVPDAAWAVLLAWTSTDDALTLADAARQAGHPDISETALRRAADIGDETAMSNLGFLLSQRGEEKEAETWDRKAAATGVPGAMYNLAVVLGESGRQEEAETWYRKAAATGHPQATNNLGNLLAATGRLGEAETCYRKAAATGDPSVMRNLGSLLETTGRLEEAETWYTQAASVNDLTAIYSLGVLLERTGRQQKAEKCYRQAAAGGHVKAMFSLGLILAQTGREEEAETWYRKAAEAGDPRAMVNLGVLLEGTGRREEAEKWFRQAAGAGDAAAMVNLGNLLKTTKRRREAFKWYREAAAKRLSS